MRSQHYENEGIRKSRRGAAAVESAVVLSVFLLVLFGLLDLGLAALNSNNLKDAAQQVCRAAIIHGSNAGPQSSSWGPATYSGTAGSSDEVASQAAAALIIMPAAKVNITVEWLDGENASSSRVRTTLKYTNPMIVPGIFGYSSIPLTAVSTMQISS